MSYTGWMRRVGIRELNQNASRVVALVKRGESVEITERGRSVARMVPLPPEDAVLAQLVAAGKVTLARLDGPVLPPPTVGDPSISWSEAIIREREHHDW